MRFEYWRNDLFKKWHWQLVAEDGTLIAMSQVAYPSKDTCLAAISTFQTTIQQVAVLEVEMPVPIYSRTHPANFTDIQVEGPL